MTEIGVFFLFYSSNSRLMAKIDVYFLWIKPKIKIKSKKYANSGYMLRKLAFSLKINIAKMEKMFKSERFMIIFALQCRF